MPLWNSEEELFSVARAELFSAVVGDVMDRIGLRRQFLPPEIRPVAPHMVVLGRAMPVLQADVFQPMGSSNQEAALQQPFGLMLRALDDLRPHEIYVAAGNAIPFALWGELMSTRARKLGSAGAVLHGYHRDTRGILDLDFPTFSWGPYAQDQTTRGKVIDFRCTVEIGQAMIRPGDLLFGDNDGVCVIPREAEREVFEAAIEKARGEKQVQKAIQGGMSAVDAFAKFGIL